jgi:repressor LexA
VVKGEVIKMESVEKILKNATERLTEVRISSGLNQKQFAEAFGVDPTTYNRYEKGGIGNMPRDLLLRICTKFSINPAWLSGFDNVEKYWMPVSDPIKPIPIIGTIAAGDPITAYEDVIGYEYILEREGVDFCLRVSGDSMIGARIFNGDIAFVRRQNDVDNGDIAVVMIDGEATLKRVYKEKGKIILHAENPTIPDRIISAKDNKQITILGKVKFVKFETR